MSIKELKALKANKGVAYHNFNQLRKKFKDSLKRKEERH